MRSLRVFFIFSFIVTNCFGQKLGRSPVPVHPYIQLKDSTTVTVDAVHFKSGFIGNKLVTPGQTFKTTEIFKYSDGKKTYMNFGGYGFGEKIAEGKIDVYEAIVARYGTSGPMSRVRTYVQDSITKNVSFYGYKSLSRIIPKNTPAGIVLTKCRINRALIKASLIGGVGIVIAGTAIAGGAIMNDGNANPGLYLMLGGAAVITSTFVIGPLNYRKMSKAVGMHNGVIQP